MQTAIEGHRADRGIHGSRKRGLEAFSNKGVGDAVDIEWRGVLDEFTHGAAFQHGAQGTKTWR
jgi:hypothetical protein